MTRCLHLWRGWQILIHVDRDSTPLGFFDRQYEIRLRRLDSDDQDGGNP